MTALARLRSLIEPLLGPAPLKLYDAVAAHAKPGDGDDLFAAKADVHGRLQAGEGGLPEAAALRQRIVQINGALKAHGVRLRSGKAGYTVAFSPGSLGGAARDAARAAVTESTIEDTTLPPGFAQEPRVLRLFTVAISHGWESKEIESAVDHLVDELKGRLDTLPPRWQDRIKVELFFDRKSISSTVPSFEHATDPVFEKADFCIFLLSDKFYASKACRREASFFIANGALKPGRTLRIQASGHRRDGIAPFTTGPVLPEHWNGKWSSWFELFHNGNPHDRLKFIEHVREEILKALPLPPTDGDAVPATDPKATPHTDKRKGRPADPRDLLRQASGWEFDEHVRDGSVEEPQVTMAEGADGATPILPLLEEWATSPVAANRLSVLLGSFGSGKTTTSQLLAQRLLERREADPAAPFPVYLDFRRLNDAYGDRNPSSLVELIVGSLAPAYRDRIDAATILPLLRDEPCVIIFDGLDEIGTRIGHERASQIYRQLLEIVPREAWNADMAGDRETPDWTACPVRLLVTCRTHFFRSHIEEESTFSGRARQDIRPGTLSRPRIAVWYMAPFTPDQIRSFFVRSLDAEQGAKTFAAIARVGDLDGLAAKPIMTRYITEIAPALLEDHAAGRPINAARIYRHLFDSALERDRDKRLLLTPDDRLRLLQSLALKLWRDRKPVIRIDELERWFDAYAIDDPGLKLIAASGREARHLLHLELRNASLLVRGQDDGFRFVHTSFGEYFLACGLLETLLNRAYAGLGDMAPVSEETIGFLLDLAEIGGTSEILRAGTDALLCSDETAARRQFAERLRREINGRFGWRDMPAGANLADLDCSEIHFVSPTGGQMFSRVRFDRAHLFKARFTDASFDGCSFDGAVLAQAEFDRCRFVACTGAPRELGSVRIHRSDVSGSPDLDFRAVVLRTDGRLMIRPGRSRITLGHGNTVNAVAFAPDGRTVITGSWDNTARLWDAATDTEIKRFEGHGDKVTAVAFAPDGKTVITGSYDETARLWDATTGTEIRRFEGHDSPVNAVAFAPDGRTVITGSEDNTARLWDAATGTEIRRFEGHDSPVNAVAFAPDGRTVTTGSDDNTARLWDAATGTEIRRFEGHGDPVTAVAFAPDGRTIITGSDDNTARLWDTATGTEIRRFEGHGNPVNAVAFAPDGRTFITGSDDSTARLWDAATGTEIRRFEGHGSSVTAVACAPGGSTVITGSFDNTARLWDAATGTEIRRLERHGDWITVVAFAPNGSTFITGSYDNTARLWDAATGNEIRRFEGHGDAVTAVAFAPDGSTFITGSYDNTARLWDAATGTEIRRLERHGNTVTAVAFAPDGRTVITGSGDDTARLWDAATGTEIGRFEGHSNTFNAVAFAPDGRTVITGSPDNTARLWDATTGTEIRRFERHGSAVAAVAFAPDGRTVITGSGDDTARLWDAATGTEIGRFEGHGSAVAAVAVAPDGKTVLTGSWDNTARLWDAATRIEIRRFQGHGDWVTAVAFAPDGKTLLTGSHDGTTRLWDAATGKVLRIMVALPDSWAVLDEDMTVTDIGPNAWRYLYEIGTGPDGKPVVLPPECDDGGEFGADG
jgi:WD40 repeat protein